MSDNPRAMSLDILRLKDNQFAWKESCVYQVRKQVNSLQKEHSDKAEPKIQVKNPSWDGGPILICRWRSVCLTLSVWGSVSSHLKGQDWILNSFSKLDFPVISVPTRTYTV